MSKEIVINAGKQQTRIAIVEQKRLVELYIEHQENARTIGNIHLGRVRKVMPSIKACFVDVGQKQDAFLHFSDLSDNLPALLQLVEEKVPDPADSPIPDHMFPQEKAVPLSEDFDIQAHASKSKTSGTSSRSTTRTRSRSGGRSSSASRPARTTAKSESTDASSTTEKDGAEAKAPAKPTRRRSTKPRTPKKTPNQDGSSESEGDGNEKKTAKSTPTRRRSPRRTPAKSTGTSDESDKGSTDATTGDETAKPRSTRSRSPRSRSRRPAGKTAQQPSDSGEEARTKTDSRSEGSTGQASSAPQTAKSTEISDARPVDTGAPLGSEPKMERTAPPNSDAPAASVNLAESPVKPSPPAQSPSAQTPVNQAAPPSIPDSPRPDSSAASGSHDEGKSIAFATATQANTSKIFTAAAGVHPARYLREGQRILVKISKEPISSKGSRVSTDISIAGRFLVLVPCADYVAVSKKISSAKERRRLRALADSLLPDGFGVIVRTVAEDRDAKSLDTDLKLLLDKWSKIAAKLKENLAPPVALYQDVNLVSSVIRDLFSEDYDRILIDNQRTYRNIKGYVQAVAPSMINAVKLHESSVPVFKEAGIDRAVEEAFSSRVNLPSGGYLFIEHTEAMHVVDVNSGRAGHGLSQEDNSLNVNVEAARVIAQQLRIRDLGGIIVVDFIDLRHEKNRKKVHKTLKDEFARDRAVTKVLPMSNFGLVEITRQRLRPSVTISQGPDVQEKQIEYNLSTEELIHKLEAWLASYKATTSKTAVNLHVHPFLANYLKKGILSYPTRWRLRYGVRIKMVVTETVDPIRFKFFDPETDEDLTSIYDYS